MRRTSGRSSLHSALAGLSTEQDMSSATPSNIIDIHSYKHNHAFRKNAHFGGRTDLKKGKRAPADLQHRVIFAVKPLNREKLIETLYDVSDPASRNYGKHWTKDQVMNLIGNPEGYAAIVNYLNRFNIAIVDQTVYQSYIFAEASIGEWESFFQTKFYEFTVKSVERDGKPITTVRAESYSLPHEIAEHTHAAFRTVHFPHPMISTRMFPSDKEGASRDISQKLTAKQLEHQERLQQLQLLRGSQPGPAKRADEIDFSSPGVMNGYVTPELLNQYYNISNNNGSAIVSQAVLESLNDALDPNDLTLFQQYFNLTVEPIAQDIGGHVTDQACDTSLYADCGESNLDVQYLMGIAENIPTTYWYVDNSDDFDWLSWITAAANMTNPQNVFSMSYVTYEDVLDSEITEAWDTEAIILGTLGSTIFSAAGDDGAPGYNLRDGTQYCGYYAMYPADSPYVTAIGGTNGPQNNNDPEVACQSGPALITTGGGFSNLYAQPSFQQAVVNEYFQTVDGTWMQPYTNLTYNYASGNVPGYFNRSGRGYPDVSALAHAYLVFINGSLVPVDGTSASTPFMAAMTNLVNYQRKLQGYSAVGWLNPFLYTYYPQFTHDITSGKNNCSAVVNHTTNFAYCCPEGFYAAKGWDPLTGLGSVNYYGYLAAAMAAAVTPMPTAFPTLAPTHSSSSDSNWNITGFAVGVMVVGILMGLGLVLGNLYMNSHGLTAKKTPLSSQQGK